MTKSLRIVPLTMDDSQALSDMLLSSSPEYQKYFTPFPFGYDSILQTLSLVREDRYWGIWLDKELAGFFMLRGMDSGFEVPSYGVSIAERYAGCGLMTCTLHFVKSWCKLNHVRELMLKVHPENFTARATYESFGFVRTGVDPKNDNLIYQYRIPD